MGGSGDSGTVFNPYQGYYGNYQGGNQNSNTGSVYDQFGGTGMAQLPGGGGPMGYGYIGTAGGNSLDPITSTMGMNLGGGNLSSLEGNSLSTGISNLQESTNEFLPLIGQYLGGGQQGVNQATAQALPGIQNIYGTGVGAQQALTGQGLGQSQQITGQNLNSLNDLMNNYDKNFVSQLGPQGQLGQQLMGEFNNYGLTPESGAFQSALGNQLGSLGAQNQLQLGSQLVNQGAGAQQNLLSQGLGGQLSTAQQGTGQAGGLLNAGGITNQQLGAQMGTAPLSLLSNTLGQEQSLINEGTQLPIQQFLNSLGFTGASQLGQQNANAQNYGAQMGLLGNLGGGALSGIGAASGK